MDQICGLLDKNGLQWSRDESLEIPHIVYEQVASDKETVISHNFIVKYCDLRKRDLITTKDLEKNFYDFERKYFSKYFFREDTDLKWNFYLILIVDENESKDSDICQLEQDDKYLRKLVMTKEELEVYICQGIKNDAQQVISGLDTYAEWQRELSKVKLDGILTNSYQSIKVQNYIEKDIPIRLQGSSSYNWEDTEKENPKFLIKKIEALSLENFRNHCLADHLEIPLSSVNLISGCNGAGKSSLCAAIEYALTGEISDSKEEKGKAKVRIRNRENEYVDLDFPEKTREKKALDQLWYGTVTMARYSSLNRNFHTFNYLGLEASGKYMQQLDIDELVKNVLFGFEVTEAELKMKRYGSAFADKKREYLKRLEAISQELDTIHVDYDVKGISVEDIYMDFLKLGYREEVILRNQDMDYFLRDFRKILLENNQYVGDLSSKCDKDETGSDIIRKMKSLNESRERCRALGITREKLRKDLQDIQQKSQDSRVFLKKLYENIEHVHMLIQQGEEMRNIFLCKQDFIALKKEFEKNRSTREELIKWVDQYQPYLFIEENEIELMNEIKKNEKKIDDLDGEIIDLGMEIELQKKKYDTMDTMIQEILSIAEDYVALNEYVENCPVCGRNFASRERLMKVIRNQRQIQVMDETQLQKLLKQKSEKENCLNVERDSLKRLKDKKEKVSQKRIAITILQPIMPINENKKGKDIHREVTSYIEQIQDYQERNINRYRYVQEVIETDEFVNYTEDLDWITYLKRNLKNLEKQKAESELCLQNQKAKEHELEQQYQKAMGENVVFSMQEWEEYKIKADGFQVLKQRWKIDGNIPVMHWIYEYNIFKQKIQYAEEIYGKQEALKFKKEQIEKLEKERGLVEEWIQKCQKACDVIERQQLLKDIMEKFLTQHAKQIELFFKLLHRPKEFGKLSIEDGNIRFMRNSNGEFAECNQMSTGQRMALAFSVMITLHMGAVNAPNFLMLDEPVANLDDMHVLNLIDLLRQLAISGTQIIITTADSQMAKFLRRKFSFLKEEYSHFKLKRNGNARTFINVIHYNPNEKKEIKQPIS